MHLHFAYDEELPSRFSASIQIIRTGAAFADLGEAFTLHAGRVRASRDALLAHYGVPAGSAMHVDPFFPERGLPHRLRRALVHRRFVGSCAKAREDVVMTRGSGALTLLPALERLFAHDRPARPLILHEIHNLQFLRVAEKRAGRSLTCADVEVAHCAAQRDTERRALAAADAIVAINPEVLRAVEEEYGLDRPSLVLPSGTEWGGAAAVDQPKRYDVVYAGKLERRKGVHDLLLAMQHLPGRTLAVAGGLQDEAAEIRALARSLGIAERVTVVGLLPPAEVASFLSSGRVGVCPIRAGVDSVSDRFTSPMKLVQMMSLGMPIVASDVAPVRAIVRCGDEALLAPMEDPACVARAVQRLLHEPELAARLGAAARARAAAFAWPQRARTLRDFIEDLASRR